MKITNIKIDGFEDNSALIKFFTYMLEHFGVRSIEANEFRNCISEIANDCEDNYKDEILSYFNEVLCDGEIIDNDQEKCIETLSSGDEIGTAIIDGKPYVISFSCTWNHSPYFSLSESMNWYPWNFSIDAKEVYDENNRPSGTVKLQRKPQELNGFILTNNNVNEFYEWLQSQLPELIIESVAESNRYDGYMTKSHTQTEVHFDIKKDDEFDHKYDLVFGWNKFRINNFHYLDYTKDGKPFIHIISSDELKKEYNVL